MSSSSTSNKAEGKKPMKPQVSQKIPLPLPNRFSPLTPEKKPNILFSDIVQHSQDSLIPGKNSKLLMPGNPSAKTVTPFLKKPISKPVSSKPSSTNSSSAEKSQYMLNTNLQRIQILEDYQISKITQGFHILSDHLFGQSKTFFNDSYKTREYYQAILTDSGSVRITHRSNSRDGSTDFSKAQILKIISPEEWGTSLCSQKTLLGFIAYPSYSYFDYQEAWFKTFLFKNFSHSWFIFFDLNYDCQYPRWFVQWFKFMGLLPECLPKEVMGGFLKFKELFIQDIPEFEYLLQFSMFFKIPWIMSWTYQYQEAQATSPPWFNRQYRLKWWDKFKNSQATAPIVIKFYQELYPTIKAPVAAPTLQSDSDFVSRIMQAAGNQDEIQKLLQEFRQSPSGSEKSPSGSFKDELFQDAQDPFDDPYGD